jgi:8-amino-7-oxononanoate synthase
VVDDTQALGVLGRAPAPGVPYGTGGGGTLPHLGLAGPDLVTVASLAKGFGVPVAVLAGGAAVVAGFEAASATRMHCSPPPAPTLAAAAHALAVNAGHGERLRARLAAVVGHFRQRCAASGIALTGGHFPVQTLSEVDPGSTRRLHAALAGDGIAAVLRQGHGGAGPVLTLVLTARHTAAEVDRLVAALTRGMA